MAGNVGSGSGTIEELMAAQIASPGHYANMISNAYKYGVGIVKSGETWYACAIFAKHSIDLSQNMAIGINKKPNIQP
ncbi:hypothetical protein MCHI_002563 [Candidatus Magnetoovum chiemensis]|nr:hypothetical protein MCHI_002563 [Candidatus Magnetoovum chiemensis]